MGIKPDYKDAFFPFANDTTENVEYIAPSDGILYLYTRYYGSGKNIIGYVNNGNNMVFYNDFGNSGGDIRTVNTILMSKGDRCYTVNNGVLIGAISRFVPTT